MHEAVQAHKEGVSVDDGLVVGVVQALGLEHGMMPQFDFSLTYRFFLSYIVTITTNTIIKSLLSTKTET